MKKIITGLVIVAASFGVGGGLAEANTGPAQYDRFSEQLQVRQTLRQQVSSYDLSGLVHIDAPSVTTTCVGDPAPFQSAPERRQVLINLGGLPHGARLC